MHAGARLHTDTVRKGIKQMYTQMEHNKCLQAPWHGKLVLVLDGHETRASYLRRCPECLERTIHGEKGDRIQYYHRIVTAMLLTKDFNFLLDCELQQKGEVAISRRSLQRVLQNSPRAFDVVVADALYAEVSFCLLVLKAQKDFPIVLKDDRGDLVEDAMSLFEVTPSREKREGKKTSLWWDMENFTTGSQLDHPVRVVRLQETIPSSCPGSS